MKARVLVEGIGGIGGVIAANLDYNKHDVTLVTNNEKITSAINSNGIKLIRRGETMTKRVTAHNHLDEVEGEYDIVLLVMKATDVVDAAKRTKNYLSEGGYVVTMQNGIVEDAVTRVVGEERVISAIIGWGGTMQAPGIYEKTSPGQIHIGELDGSMSPRLSTLVDLLEPVSPVVATRNILGALWAKLAINSCVTTLGAVTGKKLGPMLKSTDVREIFLDIYQEVVDTASASGVKLEKIAANPYLFYRKENSGKLNSFVRHQLLKIVGKKYSNIKSSMLQSLERGRNTEIEFLNGYVVKKGEEVGVPTRTNRKAVEVIRLIEGGELTPDMQNIRHILEN